MEKEKIREISGWVKLFRVEKELLGVEWRPPDKAIRGELKVRLQV